MKRLLNRFVFGLTVMAVGAVGTVMAQDAAAPDEKTVTYNKFTACYKVKEEAPMKECLAVGKEYMTKWGTPEDDFNKFVGKQNANIEARLKQIPITKAYARREAGFTNKNLKEIIAGGKEINNVVDKDSLKLDNNLIVVIAGYDNAFAPTTDASLHQETVGFAKNALRMLDSGIATEPQNCSGATGANPPLESVWGGCGGYSFGSKENAQAWMNYIIARITVDTNKDKDEAKALGLLKEAAPYYYKALQIKATVPSGATYKGFKEVGKDAAYNSLGRYYLAEYNAAVEKWNTACKAAADDPAAVETEECKNIIGLQKAYAERAADASARAYNSIPASTDPKVKTYKDSLLDRTKKLYEARFKKADGVNEFIAKTTTTPLADPTAQVTPIIEAPPATTTTTTTTPATTTPAKTGTTPSAATKPAAGKGQN